MAFKHGKSTQVFCDSYELSSYFNSATITQTGEPNETSTFTNTSKTFIKGLTSGSLSLEGLYESSTDIDPTATTKTFDQFLEGLISATNPSVITWVPYTMAAGSWVKGAYARLFDSCLRFVVGSREPDYGIGSHTGSRGHRRRFHRRQRCIQRKRLPCPLAYCGQRFQCRAGNQDPAQHQRFIVV